jgi:hypothetical protein
MNTWFDRVEPTRGRWLAMALLVALLAGCGASESTDPNGDAGGDRALPSAVDSSLPAPKVTGPIDNGLRGGPWGAALDPLAPYDYVEEEYFYSGTAQARSRDGELSGRSAEYTTRMIVRRPRSAEAFNGTVLMEWFNVTAEMDIGVLWGMTHPELLRSGYAYVGVSVQKIGVDASPLGVKFWDLLRYAPLRHPGDAYAFDIWSHAARALVARDGPAPLGELQPRRLIASGESQSAAYLIPYVNRVDAEHRVFDGYLIHTYPGPIAVQRDVPVLMFLSETEKEGTTAPGGGIASLGPIADLASLVPALGLLAIPASALPSEDSEHLRVWEVAGASHYDQQAIDYMAALLARDLTAPLPTPPIPVKLPCLLNPINQLAQERVVRAALHALNGWMISGRAPASMPRLQQDQSGALLRDADGLAQGGIRVPPVAVPVGVNEGKTCIFFGSYKRFSNARIRELYPTAEDYRRRVREAADESVQGGWLLQEGADAYIEEADTVDVWSR